MITDLVIFLSCDYLFNWFSPYYRRLNNFSILGALFICLIPWTEILDDLGLGFVSSFMTLLARGYCPLVQVVGNTFLLGLKQLSLGAVNPPFLALCGPDNSFSDESVPMILVYWALFGSIDVSVRLFQYFFSNKRATNSLKARTCSDGNQCIHYKALQSMNKHIQYNLNMENK